MLTTWISMQKMGGGSVESSLKPVNGMVIAAVPDPAKPGAMRLEQVMLSDMDIFKAANPTHSFLIPAGAGQLRTQGSDRSTTYEAQAMPDGKVLVETKFHQEMGGLLIMRYEAGDKSVRPVFFNNVQWLVPLLLGFMLAVVLYIFGRILKSHANRAG